MEIDWLTVIAQIINFLILIWLLKRFLYRPVITAMDRREQGISERLRQAESREQAATATANTYKQKMQDLERERSELIEQAKGEAQAEGIVLLNAAREDITQRRTRWQQQIDQEKEDFLRDLKQRSLESVQQIARKALGDLADVELEAQIIRSFLRRLDSLDTQTRDAFAASAVPLELATSFSLDPAEQVSITRAVNDKLGRDAQVVFHQSPNLLCGIEMTASGRRLNWDLTNYLEGLEQDVRQHLEMSRGTTR